MATTNPYHFSTPPHPTYRTIPHSYTILPDNTTFYYEHYAENEPDLPGWEVIDLTLLVYWPAVIVNIILMTILIARAPLRRRPNSPLLITICIINIIIVAHIYVSYFHRYSVPIYLKMKGLCELITVIWAIMRVFTPYIYILMAAERLYTIETSRTRSFPPLRMRYSFLLLGVLFAATLIIALTGILGISGGFYYDYTIDGERVCFVVFSNAGYNFYTVMLFVMPGLMMLALFVLLIIAHLRIKFGYVQNLPIRMRETDTRENTMGENVGPRSNGCSVEAGGTNPMNTTDPDNDPCEVTTGQVDSVIEEQEAEDPGQNIQHTAWVAWATLAMFFVPWTLQVILHFVSWYVGHYFGRTGEHVLNIFLILYPLSWLILDLEIRAAYRPVCCICLPRRAPQDDEERLV